MKALYLLFFGVNALIAANPVRQNTPKSAQPSQIVKLSIALQPESRQLLEQTLHDLSSPFSRRYGQHLGREEAKALLRPRRASSNAVKGWLSRAGIPAGDVLSDGQFIHVRTVAEQVEALLGVTYNETLGSQTIAVSSLPEQLQGHVVTVQYAPVQRRTACSVPKANASSSSTDLDPKHDHRNQSWTETRVDWEECKSKISPSCLKKLYNVGDYHAKYEKSNLFGIAGFDGVSSIS
jgi:tripeptidyl-peptidase-1